MSIDPVNNNPFDDKYSRTMAMHDEYQRRLQIEKDAMVNPSWLRKREEDGSLRETVADSLRRVQQSMGAKAPVAPASNQVFFGACQVASGIAGAMLANEKVLALLLADGGGDVAAKAIQVIVDVAVQVANGVAEKVGEEKPG